MSDENQRGPVVELKGACRYYETEGETIKALDDVTMTIDAGEFMTVAGPSGSGKSTLLNLIGALDVPTQGEVLIDGQSLGALGEANLARLRRSKIGFVFQAYNLIPVLSVLENVEYVMMLQGIDARTRHRRAQEILEEVGLGDKGNRRPAQLSGGQQQRVAVARAIVSKPALVLADEPTANLDSVTGEALLDMMQRLNQELGMTFVFSTHDPMVIERASRVVRLRDGQIESDERTS